MEEIAELVEGQPLTTANAPDFKAHNRAMGRGPKTEPTPPVDKPAPAHSAGVNAEASEGKPESAGVPETPEKKINQETGTKDRSAAGRFSELTAARKRAEEERDQVKRELEELRKTGTRKPEEKPAEAKPAATAEPAKTDGKPKPTLKEFSNDPKYKHYEDAVEAYSDARDAWKDEQAAEKQRKADQDREASERRTQNEARIKPWKEKHPDIEEKILEAVKAMPDLSNEGMQAAFKNLEFSDHALLGDVLYELAGDHAEYKRIASLPPAEAFKEANALAAKLSGTTKTPETKKPPQSRTPDPPVVVSGAGNPSLSTAGAKNWREHNLARGRKDGTATGA